MEATGKRTICGFEPGRHTEILPTSPVEFFREELRSPRIQFDLGVSGQVIGLTINPENWPVKASKLP